MPSIPQAARSLPRVIAEIEPEMAKAVLRKTESADALREIGECLDDARADLKWTLDRLAAELKRDARQVRRWIAGDERTQVDVVFSVDALRAPFVIALARLAAKDDSGVVIRTTVELRQRRVGVNDKGPY